MPNAKVLSEKQAIVEELAQKMQNAAGGVFVDYKGITVADDFQLRNKLRESDIEYAVVKNTLTRFAANKIGFDALDPHLNGTTALGMCKSDPIATARILSEYAEKSGGKFTIKAGFVEGRVIDADGVKALATLPSKDVIRAQALGTLLAPISSFATVLNATIRGLAIALNAIAEKKGEAA